MCGRSPSRAMACASRWTRTRPCSSRPAVFPIRRRPARARAPACRGRTRLRPPSPADGAVLVEGGGLDSRERHGGVERAVVREVHALAPAFAEEAAEHVAAVAELRRRTLRSGAVAVRAAAVRGSVDRLGPLERAAA